MASVGAGEALTTARWAMYLVALGLALPATALFSYAFLGNLETRQYERLHQPSEIATKLREADTLVAQGMSSADVARAVGVSQATYARWRRQYGKLLSTTTSSSAQQAQGTERRS
jgi:ABC-type protease/lipase transport system fused ATPase/permease subunit